MVRISKDDIKRIVLERHGIKISDNEPAFIIVTMFEVFFEKYTETIDNSLKKSLDEIQYNQLKELEVTKEHSRQYIENAAKYHQAAMQQITNDAITAIKKSIETDSNAIRRATEETRNNTRITLISASFAALIAIILLLIIFFK